MAESAGLKVKKSENFSEWFTQICLENGAQLVDIRYNVQGFIVHRPWGFKILRRIYELFEKAVEEDSHEPYLFPNVIPEENLQKEAEHAGFIPDVFWVTKAGTETLEKPWALRPTGETQIYPMYSLWLRSYNDLPFKFYQSRLMSYRNEKTTRPFLRGREFMFFETHDVFAKHEEAMAQIKKDMEIMEDVVRKKLKIPFLFFRRPQWDKFKGANDTYASDVIMPDGRRNQMSSTHDLGQNFAKAFDIKFKDFDGQDKYGWQTCFGPGIWRIMAGLIAVHGDDTGLVLPFDLAPLKVIIIPITFSKKEEDNKKVIDKCKEIEKKIKELGFTVKVDDSDATPGYKYNHWEMFGVPLRIELGPREADASKFTIARRTDKKKETHDLKDLKNVIEQNAELLDAEIEKKSEEYFKENAKEAKSFDELKANIEKFRGFVKVPLCTIEMDGKSCGEKIKEETTADICGTLFGKEEKPHGNCIVCGKPAKAMVYIAKSI